MGVAGELVAWRRVSRGSYKPFLHHVTKGRPIPTRPVKLIVTRRMPRTLDAGQVAAILAACGHLRDRFLLALLAETGMRVGQALGLRHSDFVSRRREISIVARPDNANGARDLISRIRSAPARSATTRAAQRATAESLRARLDTARTEISRLRAENTMLREQAARHLGEQRAAIHPIHSVRPR